MKIVDIREENKPIKSQIRNAYIDFSKMTLSLVAVITDVIRDGKPVVGYGFNSNGRYGQGALIRERFRPRVLEAKPESLLDNSGNNLDPAKGWPCMMTIEKPGGHGERHGFLGQLLQTVQRPVLGVLPDGTRPDERTALDGQTGPLRDLDDRDDVGEDRVVLEPEMLHHQRFDLRAA